MWLCRFKETNDLCAVKMMSKSLILRRKQVEHVFSEVEVMRKMRHPFIATCYGSFQDDKYLYIAMEYLGGRDLFFHLKVRIENKIPQVAVYLCVYLVYFLIGLFSTRLIMFFTLCSCFSYVFVYKYCLFVCV